MRTKWSKTPGRWVPGVGLPLGRLMALIAVASLAAACAPVTRVVLVRHGERGNGQDPPLTTQGQQRAQALVPVVEGAGLSAIFRTQLLRSVQTAAPVAQAVGLTPIEVILNSGQEAQHATQVINRIQGDFKGRTVLVVGHTTTLPVIIRQLGVSTTVNVPEDEFDHLFIVIKRADRPGRLIHGRYGCPMRAACAACNACP